MSRVGILLIAALVSVTARAGIAPESPTTQVKTASPGSSYRATLLIRNAGSAPADVKIYQTDYAFAADGSALYVTPGSMPRSNAPWVHLGQEQISIAPGELGRIDYEVRVPQDERLTGTYWSTLMVEQVGGVEASGEQRSRMQLRQTLRHAIQVITEIGATGKGEIAFRNARVLTEAGKRELSVDLENTGERWLQTQLWLELHDATGHSAGKFTGQRRRTFPATSARHRIDLTSVPPGKYVALLVADGGRNDLFGTQIELDLR